MSEVKKMETLSLLLGREVTNETPFTQVEINYIDTTFGEFLKSAKHTILVFDGSAPYIPKDSKNKMIPVANEEHSISQNTPPVQLKTSGELFREKYGKK